MRWWARLIDVFIGAIVATFLLIGYSVIHLHDAAEWAAPQHRRGRHRRRPPAKTRHAREWPVYTS